MSSGRWLKRVVVIFTGYLAACLVAAVVAALMLMSAYPIANYLITEGPLWGLVVKYLSPLGIFSWGTFVIILLTFVPALLIAIGLEWYRVRALRHYLICAVVISFVAILILGSTVYYELLETWRGTFNIVRFAWTAFATFVFGLPASLTAGYVYWRIAGRHAGNWKQSTLEGKRI
jgi:hypothetical protein